MNKLLKRIRDIDQPKLSKRLEKAHSHLIGVCVDLGGGKTTPEKITAVVKAVHRLERAELSFLLSLLNK